MARRTFGTSRSIKASIRLATAFFQPGNAAMYAFTAVSPSGLAERTGVRGRAVVLRTGVFGFGVAMPWNWPARFIGFADGLVTDGPLAGHPAPIATLKHASVSKESMWKPMLATPGALPTATHAYKRCEEQGPRTGRRAPGVASMGFHMDSFETEACLRV